MPAPIDDPSEAVSSHLVWDLSWIQIQDWGIVLLLGIAWVTVLVIFLRTIRRVDKEIDQRDRRDPL